MGMIDMFLTKEVTARAAQGLAAGEEERKARIRSTLAAAGISNESLVDQLCSASSQASSLKSAANAIGKGPLVEILNRIAEKLEVK